jgi:hypothetical protein
MSTASLYLLPTNLEDGAALIDERLGYPEKKHHLTNVLARG